MLALPCGVKCEEKPEQEGHVYQSPMKLNRLPELLQDPLMVHTSGTGHGNTAFVVIMDIADGNKDILDGKRKLATAIHLVEDHGGLKISFRSIYARDDQQIRNALLANLIDLCEYGKEPILVAPNPGGAPGSCQSV